MEYHLVLDDGRRVSLEIANDLKPSFLQIGKRFRIYAVEVSADRYKVVKNLEPLTTDEGIVKTVRGISPVLGPQRTWTLLVKFSDIPNEPMTPSQINEVVYERKLYSGGSLRELIIDNSFGKASVVGYTVGWYNIDSSDHYNPSDPGNLCDASISAVVEALTDALNNLYSIHGIQVSDHDRIILFFNVDASTFGGCAFAFLGYITVSLSYGDRIVSAQYMPTDSWGTDIGVIAHEYGHQMGLPHTSYLTNPYDSPWDIMSGASGKSSFMAESRRLLGWISDDAIITIKSRSGAATLVYLTTSGVEKGLKEMIIEDYPEKYWTLEVRLREGYDEGLPNNGLITHYCDLYKDDWICNLIDSTPGDSNPSNAQFDLGDTISHIGYSGKSIFCEVVGEIGSSRSYRVLCSGRTWQSLGGKTDTFPVLIDDKAIRYGIMYTVPKAHIIVKGLNDCGYRKYMDPKTGDFTSWTSTGICSIPEPPVATLILGHIILVQRTDQDAMYTTWIDVDSGLLSNWSKISGTTPSRPALAGDIKTNTVHLVVKGSDDKIWYRNWHGPWYSLGGKTQNSPAAHASNGKLHVVVVGTDSKIYYKRLDIDSNTWTDWINLGGRTNQPPAIISNEETVLVVVKGMDNKLYANELSLETNMWSGWYSLGGSTIDQSVLVGFEKAGISIWYLIVKGGGGTIWYRYMIPHWEICPYIGPNCWSNWIKVPGKTTSIPAADVDQKLNLQLAVRGADDRIYFTNLS